MTTIKTNSINNKGEDKMKNVKWFNTEKGEFPDIDLGMEYVDVWVYQEGVVQHGQYENPGMNESYFQLEHGECIVNSMWTEYIKPDAPG